jgi:C-terminal processing protease CtpA/Prc
MKNALLEELMNGKKSADEAVAHYTFWFYKNFDRHTNCSAYAFWALQQECHPDYRKLIGNYAPEPVACLVDKETYLLRLPSCEGDVPTEEWVEKKAEEFLQSGCKYLILDLRGNGGGSDHISLIFSKFMCDSGSMIDEDYFYRVSAENDKRLTMVCETAPGNFFDRVLEESKAAEDGSLINWISFRKGGEMKPMVRKGAIIIDGYSASAAETPVRFVHNHSKTHAKVYGRDNTLGCEQTGNCHEVRLPHSHITMRYPTTVDDIFEHQCRLRNPGYKPDVIIPLPYPKQLTDNIDPWVLWVAKDLKKK